MKWTNVFFATRWGHFAKNEYSKLLSVKISECEAEQLMKNFVMQHISEGSHEEKDFWFALALRQWELGRLSDRAKSKALYWIEQDGSDFDREILSNLKAKLLEPMPAKKTIRPPSGLKKCPYPVGSLLAYRIISDERLKDTPFWEKYVLLRVIKIKRNPVSRLAPDAAYSESMLVGLYNWIGSAIPPATIADDLEFTPVAVIDPVCDTFDSDRISKQLPKKYVAQITGFLTSQQIETCCCLDWNCAKGIDSNEVFTYLGKDERYEREVPSFFYTRITDYAFSHSIPFDAMLKKRFVQLAEEAQSGSV